MAKYKNKFNEIKELPLAPYFFLLCREKDSYEIVPCFTQSETAILVFWSAQQCIDYVIVEEEEMHRHMFKNASLNADLLVEAAKYARHCGKRKLAMNRFGPKTYELSATWRKILKPLHQRNTSDILLTQARNGL